MRKILFILTYPSTEKELLLGVDTVMGILKTFNVKYSRIDYMHSFFHLSSHIKLPEEFNEVLITNETAFKLYDDVYIIGNNDKDSPDDNNSYTFNLFSSIINKTTLVNIEEELVNITNYKEVIIDDFIGDAFVVKNDPAEIQKFINIYLDNIKLGADTPKDSKMVKDAKIGLNILLNKLQGINAS